MVSAGPPAVASSLKLTLSVAKPGRPLGVYIKVPLALKLGGILNMPGVALKLTLKLTFCACGSPSSIELAQFGTVCALVVFGAETWLPSMVSLSLIREIAPVITALICAGKIASSISAELGSMKVTEQIDAMEVSAVNPYKYLVVTRILATTIMVPILVIYADLVGVYGGYIGYNIHGDITMFRYFSDVFEHLEFLDIIPATIKTFFFGFFIGMIGCYKGFNASNGTAGVGIAANSAVVSASLSIFIIDMLAVQITDFFF